MTSKAHCRMKGEKQQNKPEKKLEREISHHTVLIFHKVRLFYFMGVYDHYLSCIRKQQRLILALSTREKLASLVLHAKYLKCIFKVLLNCITIFSEANLVAVFGLQLASKYFKVLNQPESSCYRKNMWFAWCSWRRTVPNGCGLIAERKEVLFTQVWLNHMTKLCHVRLFGLQWVWT